MSFIVSDELRVFFVLLMSSLPYFFSWRPFEWLDDGGGRTLSLLDRSNAPRSALPFWFAFGGSVRCSGRRGWRLVVLPALFWEHFLCFSFLAIGSVGGLMELGDLCPCLVSGLGQGGPLSTAKCIHHEFLHNSSRVESYLCWGKKLGRKTTCRKEIMTCWGAILPTHDGEWRS